MELHFLVQKEENNMLLRDFLRRRKVSAGMITQVKAATGFFCEDSPVHTNRRIQAGQMIHFALPQEQETSVQPQALPLAVRYEDAHAMVLDKPPGQTVHPTRGYADGTLANAFCGEMARRGQTDTTVFRPVNRIDRNTSGLVLCAMNAYAASVLAQSAEKVYYAIVEGELPLGGGEINAPIAMSDNSLICRCVAADGRQSLTRYTVLTVGGGFSLVRCIPVTGRTHQIRVHFAHIGYPLAGDDLYGASTQYLARHALHCGEISFCAIEKQLPQPTGARVCVKQPLPSDMRTLMQTVMAASQTTKAPDMESNLL